MGGNQLSSSAIQKAASAYFGEIAEDGFWKDILPQRTGVLSALTKRSLPFEDGVALHRAALAAIMGSPEKGIEPVRTISEMQSRLGNLFDTASKDHQWKSRRLAKEVSRKAMSTALSAAKLCDGIEGISL